MRLTLAVEAVRKAQNNGMEYNIAHYRKIVAKFKVKEEAFLKKLVKLKLCKKKNDPIEKQLHITLDAAAEEAKSV